MAWEGVVAKYHEQHCKELEIDRRIEVYRLGRAQGLQNLKEGRPARTPQYPGSK